MGHRVPGDFPVMHQLLSFSVTGGYASLRGRKEVEGDTPSCPASQLHAVPDASKDCTRALVSKSLAVLYRKKPLLLCAAVISICGGMVVSVTDSGY